MTKIFFSPDRTILCFQCKWSCKVPNKTQCNRQCYDQWCRITCFGCAMTQINNGTDQYRQYQCWGNIMIQGHITGMILKILFFHGKQFISWKVFILTHRIFSGQNSSFLHAKYRLLSLPYALYLTPYILLRYSLYKAYMTLIYPAINMMSVIYSLYAGYL